MALLLLTASHRELDLAELERVSAGAGSVAVTAKVACAALRGAVAISTCNRFELYLDVEAPGEMLGEDEITHARQHIGRLIAGASGVSPEVATRSFTARTGLDVVRHLFRVAAGLESMVVGEREIAGQVRRALAAARADGTTSKVLELLFQSAARASKQVAAETSLGGVGRSLVAVALDAAEPHLDSWAQVRVTLIGTGSYAGAVVAALNRRGCTTIGVYSRSGRAARFAESHGTGVIDDADASVLPQALAASDLVVAVSGARGKGPDLAHLVNASHLHQSRSLVVIDLALHRDIDPRVSESQGVVFFDLEGLRAKIPPADSAVVGQAERIIEIAAQVCWSKLAARSADPAVARLVDSAEREVEREIAVELERRRAAGDAPDDAAIADLSRAIRRRRHRALHEQITQLRAAVTT